MLRLLSAGALLAAASLQAQAASVTLCAKTFDQALPGATVPMWGYAATCTGSASSPGPVITVPQGDATLSITLTNNLTVPTSIVLTGQSMPAGMAPVHAVDVIDINATCQPTAPPLRSAFPDTPPGRTAYEGAVKTALDCRVRSFTGETAPGATQTYVFNNLKPGTYLYQSGTHPQVQVQMGLFGMMKQDAAPPASVAGRFLFANSAFDVDVPVVLSEIDPDLHVRVAGTLGSLTPASWKAGNNTTLDYNPRYFLINGAPFAGTATDLPVTAHNAGRVVLRMANAGLRSRTLVLNNGHWQLLTEDGNAYPAPREQYSAFLPAGKTADAQIVASVPSSSLAVFDRRGGTDNADGSALGGQVARVVLAEGNLPPSANAGPDQTVNASSATLALAGAASDDGLPAPPTLTSTWSAVSGPAGGFGGFANALALGTTATFNLAGSYTLRLTVSDGQYSVTDDVVVNLVQSADLSITKTDNATSVIAGNAVAYTIVVSNAGPNAVVGATVIDNMPAALTGVTWSCAPIASCGAASGAGSINTTVNLASAGAVTFTVSATVAATATGTLVNTATVGLPAGYMDPNPANNAATDTDAILPPPPPLPTLVTLDTFNRANANTLNNGTNWSQTVLFGNAAIRVNTNQASDVTLTGQAIWNAPAAGFGNKQGAAFTIANTTLNGDSLFLKATGGSAATPASFIRVRVTATQVVVETTANAGLSYPTNLGTFTTTFASGDRLIAVANADGSVDVWKTTTYLGRTATSAFTGAGRIGMQLPAGARVDDFAAGTVP